MTDLLDPPLGTEPPPDPPLPPGPSADPDGEWRVHTSGRLFVPRQGRAGLVYQEGNETIAEARARDDAVKDVGPKKKGVKKPGGKLPPAPTEVSLHQLEHELAEALSAPGYLAAANGDQYMADHFVTEGPKVARHLVTCAKYNPWLKARLEAAAMGQNDAMINLIMSMGLAGALVSYAIVPVVYYFDPPFLNRARDMYRIPHRAPTDQERADAVAPEAATAPQGPAGPQG